MPKGKKREATPRAPKVSPASVDVPPAQSEPPEELAAVWDGGIASIFAGMKPKHQDFLLCYIRTGNAAEAYRKAYNPLAKDHLAAVCGSQVLSTTDIQSILAKFASHKTEALFTVLHGYREMAQATKPEWKQDKDGQWENVGDAPDWQARKEALIGIRKVHGLDAADKVEHSGNLAMTHKYDIPNKRPVGT